MTPPTETGSRRRGRRALANLTCCGALAVAVMVAFATTAAAATGAAGQSLSVSPSTVAQGSAVTVSGVAPNCATVTLLSTAFPAANEFAGIPAVDATSTPGGQFRATVAIPAGRAPGGYTISARACGGNLGITVALQVTASPPVPATGAAIGTLPVGLASLLALGGAALLGAAAWRRRPA